MTPRAQEPEQTPEAPAIAPEAPVVETPEQEPEAPAIAPEAPVVETPEQEPKAPPEAAAPEQTPDRMETFEATRPNGERIRITRNIETGEQSVELIGEAADG